MRSSHLTIVIIFPSFEAELGAESLPPEDPNNNKSQQGAELRESTGRALQDVFDETLKGGRDPSSDVNHAMDVVRRLRESDG